VFKEFRKFILRGNVVDLAVAVVVGSAFSAVVTALVKDFITPLIAAIGGQHNFSALYFSLHGSKFMYGDFVNVVIAFISVSSVIFFFVVQPLNKLQSLANRRKTPSEPTERKCPECLSEIPKAAQRCKFCTAKVTPLVKL
jgi:large conductance mechanosensitive channel